MSADLYAAAAGPKRQASRLLELSPAEQVAVAGALVRDLELPDTDHETLRAVLVRLRSGR